MSVSPYVYCIIRLFEVVIVMLLGFSGVKVFVLVHQKEEGNSMGEHLPLI